VDVNEEDGAEVDAELDCWVKPKSTAAPPPALVLVFKQLEPSQLLVQHTRYQDAGSQTAL